MHRTLLLSVIIIISFIAGGRSIYKIQVSLKLNSDIVKSEFNYKPGCVPGHWLPLAVIDMTVTMLRLLIIRDTSTPPPYQTRLREQSEYSTFTRTNGSI